MYNIRNKGVFMFSKINFGIAIRSARLKKNITAIELARLANVPKSSLSDWETGKTVPSADAMFRICDALSITPTELVSYYNEMEDDYKKVVGIKIPVLGSIPAGVPIEAIEDIIDYEEIPRNTAMHGRYFALKVNGDSMLPTIKNGDIVIIRQQDDAESGKICVVMINGYDATLKEIKKDANGIWILPHNPNSDFKPTFYSNQEIESLPIKILGIAVEIRRSL